MERPYRHEAERRLCGGIPFARPPSFRRRLYAALCGKVFEAGESVGRLAVGVLGGTGSRETQTCFVETACLARR